MKKTIKKLIAVVGCVAMLGGTVGALAACGDGTQKNPTTTGQDDEVTLSSIEITVKPTKLTYDAGDELDTTGLVVVAKYSDGSNETVKATDYTIGEVDMNTMGKKTVTVTYQGKTDSFEIIVYDASEDTPVALEVTAPTKTEYQRGETVDLTGMVVVAKFNEYSGLDDKTVTADEYFVSSVDMSIPGTKTIGVTYRNVTGTFTITVTGTIPTVAGLKTGTERTYTSVMPSNWNVLTSQDNNDSQIMGNLGSAFFEYDYKFDPAKGGKFNADGSINVEAIVPGAYEVKYSAAIGLDDVTAEYANTWNFTQKQVSEGGYAWKITLRNDLKWDDGTPIKAEDFVYSMKEQLNPKFQNYRASEYYNNQIKLINAQGYLNSGMYGYENMISQDYGEDEYVALDDFVETEEGLLKTPDGKDVVLNIKNGGNWGDYGLKTYYDAYGPDVFGDAWLTVEAKADAAGYVKLTKDDVLIICDMVAVLHDYENAEEYAEDAEDYAYQEWEEFCFLGSIWGDLPFEKVGITAAGDYELVIGLTQPLSALKNDDGTLRYNAAYALGYLPLVKKDLYELCKTAPVEGSELWTSTYCTTLATTASWGPYKLTEYQSGKAYKLERNDNWYGYALEDNKNQYNITAVECEKIDNINTQWLSFLSGKIDGVGIDVTHKDDYRNSKYAVFSPGAAIYSMNIYGKLETLKTNGRNNGVLAIKDFRKAVSLAIDREEYNVATTTAMKTCLGGMNEMYYYDVENAATLADGGVYRNTTQAKEGILRAYGYYQEEDGSWSNGGNIDHATLENAYKSVTGYDLRLAKEYLEKAYKELTENADLYGYDPSKKITFLYGTSTDNEGARRDYNYVCEKIFNKLFAGTSFEGKVEITFSAEFGAKWSDDFKAGKYDIASGTGWGNAPFDPFYFISCYLEPNTSYSGYWDTEAAEMTFKMPEGDYEGAGEEYTMSVMNWYRCLNGQAKASDKYVFNWNLGFAPAEARLTLLARLEEEMLTQYYSIPTTGRYSASMLGAKFSYISYDYNTFLGFGGGRYMIVNYTDSEWEAFVKANNNQLGDLYKTTE